MELPRLEPLHKKYQSRGLEIIAIEAFQMGEMAKKFVEENNLTYHFVQDAEDEDAVVSNIFRFEGYPTTYIVNRKGRIIFSHLGFSEGDEKKLEREILSLL